MSLNDSNDIKKTQQQHILYESVSLTGFMTLSRSISLLLSKHHKKPSTDKSVCREVIGSDDPCVYTGSFYYAFKEPLI